MDFKLLENALLQARPSTMSPRADNVLNTELLQKLPADTVLRGLVKQVTELTENQRAAILTTLNKRITDARTIRPDAPTKTAAQASAQGTSDKINTPIPPDIKSAQALLSARHNLFLIEVQTTLGRILSYSQKPPQINQSIVLKVTESGQLSQQNLPVDIARPKANDTMPAAVIQASTAKAAQTNQQNTITQTRDIEQTNAGLRRYLPEQKPLTESLSALKTQLDTLSKFASAASSSRLPNNTALAMLKDLLQRMPQPADLASKNGQLQQEIVKSGQFFERSLVKNMPINIASASLDTNSRPQQIPTTINQGRMSSTKAASAPLPDDLKHLLLSIEQHLPKNPSSSTVIDKHAPALKSVLSQVISLLLKPIDLPQKTQANSSREDGIAWIEKNIRPLIQQMVARVTTQQLNNIQRQLPDGAMPQYQFELPIRIQDQLFPVILDIMPFLKKDIEKKQDKNKKDKQKNLKKMWQAHIALELQTGETLIGDISVTEETVNTQLWSDSDDIRDKIKKRIAKLKNKLHSAGINIENIEVRKKRPLSPDVRQQHDIHSLIDITT